MAKENKMSKTNIEKEDYKAVNAELVNSAVQFWANFLRDPSSFDLDNGEDQPPMIKMLAAMAKAGSKPIDSAIIEKFESYLAAIIYNKLADGNTVKLSVDYNPDKVLSDALDLAFGQENYMEKTIFPWKTYMLISLDEVRAYRGYMSDAKVLYRTNPEITVLVGEEDAK